MITKIISFCFFFSSKYFCNVCPNKVEITYNREGYGNYIVVFKNNNGIYVPIDEYKLK